MKPIVLGGVGAALLANQTNSPSAKRQVLYMERAKDVLPRLIQFLEWWKSNGTHDVLIAPDGGVRYGLEAERKQAEYFANGTSRARTLAETPHGRAAALDVWPVGFNPRVQITRTSSMELNFKRQFYAFGNAAVKFGGLEWGGNWQTLYDLPHIEIIGWRNFSYPPRIS